jgi:hypothetical protein
LGMLRYSVRIMTAPAARRFIEFFYPRQFAATRAGPQSRPDTSTWAPLSQQPSAYFTATSLKVNVRNMTPDAPCEPAFRPPETHSSSSAASSRACSAGSRSTCLWLVIILVPFDSRLRDAADPPWRISAPMTVTYITKRTPSDGHAAIYRASD